jgi:hypothetical protein
MFRRDRFKRCGQNRSLLLWLAGLADLISCMTLALS